MSRIERAPSFLVDHLRTALIGTLIAICASLFAWSGLYLLHFDENLDAVVTRVRSAAAGDVSKQARATEFLTAIEAAIDRIEARTARTSELLRSVLDHPGDEEFHKWSDEAIFEATQDLGLLSGFTPETTGLPESYHHAVINYFRAEISFAQGEDDLMKSLEYRKRPPASILKEFQDRREEMEYAGALLESTDKDLQAGREQRAEQMTEMFDSAHGEFQNLQKWGRIALFGLAVSVLGFCIMWRIAFARKKNNPE